MTRASPNIYRTEQYGHISTGQRTIRLYIRGKGGPNIYRTENNTVIYLQDKEQYGYISEAREGPIYKYLLDRVRGGYIP